MDQEKPEAPIVYVSGGKMGDFIQQLSIVYERHLMDGRPAILYIGNRGDSFLHGVEDAYRDLEPIVFRQPYIVQFSIHRGEQFDIDLSSWRRHVWAQDGRMVGCYTGWMHKEYNIAWGRHSWIMNIPRDEEWADKIIVNTVRYRFPDSIPWAIALRRLDIKNVVFVGFDETEHTHFCDRVCRIGFHMPSSLYEMFVIVHSCKLFVGSLSAPLSIAFSMDTPRFMGFTNRDRMLRMLFRNKPMSQFFDYDRIFPNARLF